MHLRRYDGRSVLLGAAGFAVAYPVLQLSSSLYIYQWLGIMALAATVPGLLAGATTRKYKGGFFDGVIAGGLGALPSIAVYVVLIEATAATGGIGFGYGFGLTDGELAYSVSVFQFMFGVPIGMFVGGVSGWVTARIRRWVASMMLTNGLQFEVGSRRIPREPTRIGSDRREDSP